MRPEDGWTVVLVFKRFTDGSHLTLKHSSLFNFNRFVFIGENFKQMSLFNDLVLLQSPDVLLGIHIF